MSTEPSATHATRTYVLGLLVQRVPPSFPSVPSSVTSAVQRLHTHIRGTVAYESQLKSDRAQLDRRLGTPRLTTR
jgi:hypothetical protein